MSMFYLLEHTNIELFKYKVLHMSDTMFLSTIKLLVLFIFLFLSSVFNTWINSLQKNFDKINSCFAIYCLLIIIIFTILHCLSDQYKLFFFCCQQNRPGELRHENTKKRKYKCSPYIISIHVYISVAMCYPASQLSTTPTS